ncbi:hypothetical protein INT43_001033, partial [Umbelopsis isabellina]
LGFDFEEEEEEVSFQASSPPDPPQHLSLDELQAIPTVLSGSDAHVDQPSSSLISANSNIPLDQQQALHMQKAFVEGMDGYEILSADEAEPMTVTREMTPEELEDDELAIDDSLTPIERISMFVKSNVILHRLLVARELPISLENMTLHEAVDIALPMLYTLGNDVEDSVRETFVVELDKIIMYYYRNAPPVIEQHTQAMKTTNIGTNDHKSGSSILSSQPSQVEAHTYAHSDADDMNFSDEKVQPSKSSIQANDETKGGHLVEAAKAEIEEKSNHIPAQAFSRLLTELLLDQNSNLAALAQQCIVSIAFQLSNIAKGEVKSDDESISPALAQELLDVEIFDGIVLGLLSIVKKAKATSVEPAQDDGSSPTDTSSSDWQIGESAQKQVFQMNEDVDQGEINLAKMVGLSLIASLAPILGEEKCAKQCLPIVEQMSADSVFYVRKEAATAIGNLATVVNQQTIINKLLPLYEAFSKDTIWHVRRSAVLTLPILCGVVPPELRAEIAVKGVELFMNDVSRNVRNMLAEIMGELITKFLPENWEETRQPGDVPMVLLEFFLSLGANTNSKQMFKLETDRSVICAFNFPAVTLAAGVDLWDSHLKNTYLTLTKDYQNKVRRTFAYSLHEIARIIGPERTEHDLVQIFALYLMDLDEVKQGVLEHLADFLAALAPSSRDEYIPILAEVWDGVMNNWRLRDILAGQLKDIAMLFDPTRVVEHIVPLALRACQDEFASVRDTGVECFPTLLEIVKQAVDDSDRDDMSSDNADDNSEFPLELLSYIMERVDEFARSERFRNRMVFAQISKSLLVAGISAWDFHSFFLPRLSLLANDLVVNVRIAVARVFETICQDKEMRGSLSDLDTTKEDSIRQSRPLDDILLQLALDEDRNVLSFVVDHVDQEILRQRQMGIAKDAMLNAANKPSVEDSQPGTPMECSSGEDEEIISSNYERAKLSELTLSNHQGIEINQPNFSIDATQDTLVEDAEAHVELRPTIDDDDDEDDDEEEFVYRPSTPPVDDQQS